MAKLVAGLAVLTANRLRDGAVVYLTEAGAWSERIEEAASAQSEALKVLHGIAAQFLATNIVVDVAAINVDLSLRERIRRTGPTVRPDLARA